MASRIFMAALIEAIAEVEEREGDRRPREEFLIDRCRAGTNVIRVRGWNYVFFLHFNRTRQEWSSYQSSPFMSSEFPD